MQSYNLVKCELFSVAENTIKKKQTNNESKNRDDKNSS